MLFRLSNVDTSPPGIEQGDSGINHGNASENSVQVVIRVKKEKQFLCFFPLLLSAPCRYSAKLANEKKALLAFLTTCDEMLEAWNEQAVPEKKSLAIAPSNQFPRYAA